MKVVASKVGTVERLNRSHILGEGGRLTEERVEPGIVFLKDARVITSLAGVVVEEADIPTHKVVYEVIGNTIDDRVEAVLVGTAGENGYPQYVAYVTPDMDDRAKKRSLTALLTELDEVDGAVVKLIHDRVTDILQGKFSSYLFDGGAISREPYAGVIIGAGQMDVLTRPRVSKEWGVYILPWSYFPTHRTIPAFNDDGETKRRLEELEARLNQGELEREERIDLLRELRNLKSYYYSPDIKRAIKRSEKEGTYFVSSKPEIRYMGENLRELFSYALEQYVAEDEHPVVSHVVVGLVSIPSFNIRENTPLFTLLPLLLGYSEGKSYRVANLNRFYQSYRELREGARDIFKMFEKGEGNLREITNASLKKRLSDIASYVLKGEGETEEVGAYASKLQAYLKATSRVVGSMYAVEDFVTIGDFLSLIPPQETSSFGKEEWKQVFTLLRELNGTMREILKEDLGEELRSVAGYFYRKLVNGQKITYTGRGGQKFSYPDGEDFTPYHLYPGKILLITTEKVLKSIGKREKVLDKLTFEIPVGNTTVSTESIAITIFFRGVMRFLAFYTLKDRLCEVPDEVANRVSSLVESIPSVWSGEGQASSSSDIQDVDVDVDDVVPLEDVDDVFVEEKTSSGSELEQESYEDDDYEIPF